MVSLGLHQPGVAHAYGSAFFLGAILVLASNTMAEVRNVPGEYATIQECIDAAEDGDQCVVASGTYNEVIDFIGKAITLRSNDGAEVTTIDGTGLNDTVVKCVSGETANTVFEGFTVTGGTGFVIGGITFGGGMYIGSGGPTVTGCVFASNSADGGGGMYNSTSVTTSVSNCTFIGNTATVRGGGMYNDIFSSPTVSDCSFTENRAVEDGGGMRNYESDATVRDCIFARNSAVSGGGMANRFGSSTIESCTFRNNSSEFSGGGMASIGSNMTVRDCRFTGNECGITRGEVDFGVGGGLYYAGRRVSHFTACVFNSNTARVSGGGVANFGGSPFFTRCEFGGNRAVNGGAMYNYDNTAPRLTSCTFKGNVAAGIGPGGAGGGLYNDYLSDPELVNCTVTGNRARIGGGMLTYDGRPRVVNSTFVGNVALENGGGIATTFLGSTFIDNSIVWGNAASGLGPQIYNDFSQDMVISYSVIQGSGGSENWDAAVATDGGGNIDADPSLLRMPYDGGDGWSDDLETPDVDEGANDDFGDLRLTAESPCVNAGDNLSVPVEVTTDLEGEDRIQHCQVDIGADESPFFLDDCNDNGKSDECDIDEGESLDCNANLRPDECDLADGTSGDCNINEVPDECDIATDESDDCNETDVPDECEVFFVVETIYVDDDAPAGGDGMGWDTAFDDLRVALLFARCNTVDEVRIAGGHYVPGAAQSDTFVLTSGTRVLGGFAGFAALDPDERDIVLNETILTGEIGDPNSETDNVWTVVTSTDVSPTTVLDGVTISDAYAWAGGRNLYGGGMLNAGGSPTILQCTFRNNSAQGVGGGFYNFEGSPALIDCLFVDNFARIGGGGMYTGWSTQPTLVRCRFIKNRTTDTTIAANGGGLKIDNGSSALLTDCEFIGNIGFNGAGASDRGNGSVFTNCLFEQNVASNVGGGMYAVSGSTFAVACNFIGNIADDSGGGAFVSNLSDARFQDCSFERNIAGGGGGLYLGSDTTVVERSTFLENNAGAGGAMYLRAADLRVNQCVFEGNSATVGGAIFNAAGSSPIVSSCVFVANHAARWGGGAMDNISGNVVISGCTFSANFVDSGSGGALAFRGLGNPTVESSILWLNGPSEIFINGGAQPFFASCDVRLVSLPIGSVDGGGNILADPLFRRAPDDGGDGWGDDPATSDVDESVNDDFGNLRLPHKSPCIDAGDPDFVPQDGHAADLDGKPRVLCGRIDIGAYELGVAGDENCDGQVRLDDYEQWPACMTGPGGGTPPFPACYALDLSPDGVIDLKDFWAYQSLSIP